MAWVAIVLLMNFGLSFIEARPSPNHTPRAFLGAPNNIEGLPQSFTELQEKLLPFFYDADDPSKNKIVIHGLLGVIGLLLLWCAKLWIKNIILKFLTRAIVITTLLGLLYALFRYFFPSL